MNSHPDRVVEHTMNARVRACSPARRRRRAARALAALWLATAALGCAQLDGGAVELTWEIRDSAGDLVGSCGAVDVETILVHWRAAGSGTSTPDGTVPFSCELGYALTPFDIPVDASQLVWLEPVCDTGEPADPASFVAPAPILRQFEAGGVIVLGQFLITARTICPSSGPPCLCQ